MKRRLLAVVFSDVVGYTSLSSRNEVAALELVELLQSLAREIVDAADGRIVKFLGDAVLAEFPSAEAALDAGLRLTSAFARKAEEAGQEAILRTGIHLGEATVAPDGDVYGDVVNVASRIQGAASPGEVMVSGDVWRQLRNRPAFEFGEALDQSLKGIQEPVTTFVAQARFQERPEAAGATPAEDLAERTRLAVLPFRLLRADPEIDFLEFSLPDAVACSLAGVNSLVVRATSSVMQYAGQTPDPRQVGREAEVDLILSGTILRAGDKVRVAAQLAEGEHGTLLWNETATVSLGDLFELQDDLAARIAESLAEPLDARDSAPPTSDRSHSGTAYELYLRANEAAIREGRWADGVELYRAALEEDPEYAPAWARLGRCYHLIGKYAGDPAVTEESFAQAEEALHRALELNPELALAHSYLAQLEVEEGRSIDGMVRLLRRVSESGAAVDFFVGLTHACRYAGLVEASLAAHERAVEMDPRAVTSVPFTHLLMGRCEEAIEASQPHAFSVIHAEMRLGRPDGAREVIDILRDRHVGKGMRDYAEALLAVTRRDRRAAVELGWKAVRAFPDPEGAFQLAIHWADLGAVDEAFDLLDGVVDGGFYCAAALRTLPVFEPLRERPEFGSLVEQADGGRAAALQAFRAEGGPSILGVEEA